MALEYTRHNTSTDSISRFDPDFELQQPLPDGRIGGLSSLDLYFRDIAHFRRLSREEEYALAMRASNGDPAAREALYNSGLRLVVFLAKRSVISSVDLMDLIQEGNIGLLTAVERFDVSRGVRFSTYARFWILQAMQKFCERNRTAIRLPGNILQLRGRIQAAENSFSAQYGRMPDTDELAGLLQETAAHIRRAKEYSYDYIPGSAPVLGREDTVIWDLIADTSLDSPIDVLRCGELLDLLLTAVRDCLTERERQVIELRYGLSGLPPMTASETAAALNRSRERISQLEDHAMEKLRVSRYAGALSDYLPHDRNRVLPV